MVYQQCHPSTPLLGFANPPQNLITATIANLMVRLLNPLGWLDYACQHSILVQLTDWSDTDGPSPQSQTFIPRRWERIVGNMFDIDGPFPQSRNDYRMHLALLVIDKSPFIFLAHWLFLVLDATIHIVSCHILPNILNFIVTCSFNALHMPRSLICATDTASMVDRTV